MADKHSRSVDLARQTTNDLGALIDRIGHADAPGGRIYSAYHTAQRALVGRLDNHAATADTLRELRRSVQSAADELLGQSIELGAARAHRNLAIYNVRPATPNLDKPQAALSAAWLSVVDAQIAQVRASSILGLDEDAILGNANQAGILTPGPVARIGARSIVSLAISAFTQTVQDSLSSSGGGIVFLRQAVAAIDERTTQTCLMAMGQVRGLDEQFHLEGRPRYADDVMAPPFHDWCRTVTALVLPEHADDRVTLDIQSAAAAELKARGPSGTNRKVIHPSNAYSRRN